MTPQEVIETLEIAKAEVEWRRPIDCAVAINKAIKAVEKQIAKKPVMKPYFKDMEEEYLCCPNCGEILTDRIPYENQEFLFSLSELRTAF